MAGRPKRDFEVKGYLLRLPPNLIERIEYCCSILDVSTRKRIPKNSRIQQALEQWCERIEEEGRQPTPAPAPVKNPVAAITATVPPEPLATVPELSPSLTPSPLERPPTTPRTRVQKKEEMEEQIQRILAAREEYERLSLEEFAQLLYDRHIYRAIDRKTGQEKPVNTGTLSRWLQQGGMT